MGLNEEVGNLILTFDKGDKIKIGDIVISYIRKVNREYDNICLGIEAPKSIQIQRIKNGKLIGPKSKKEL